MVKDTIEGIYEKHKDKLSKKKLEKKQGKIYDKIRQELHENNLDIRYVGQTLVKDGNDLIPILIELRCPYNYNKYNEKKIYDLIKKWKQEKVIDSYDKEEIAIYRLKVLH